ncbi:MAG: GntR family transcriptional regulator [Synergistaceae bacterium]|nr:GntR family transcriptional regulator [Synergistaceae bacterium]MBQ3397286.1 GntR family transcriptional regulator [Synergistaceae bacterium]MBQ6115069.1 GntR family transcriptional regulator [Synergistaceae bacterium]MBQ6417987.1 GntR family transcriptional regulator [Synergistaceae bacterium]
MLNLRPVKMMPVREQAASSLREAIITQKIKQGETLALEATARALGISVTPVREAFQILARDGLIELAQNRGAVVLGMSAKNIREHYQIRAALEAEACRIVCENRADLSEIEHCIGHLVSHDAENYGDLNQSFHYNIWLASGNSRLVNMLGELWNGLSMGLRTTKNEYAKKSRAEHENIYSMLKARDSEGASKAMRGHILRSMEDMLTRYDS